MVDDDTSTVDELMPVLAGIETRIASRHGTRERHLTEKTASARRESSREFATHVRDCFVLRGPAEQKKGEGTSSNTKNDPLDKGDDVVSEINDVSTPVPDLNRSDNIDSDSNLPDEGTSHANLTATDDANTSLLSRSNLGVSLLDEIRGKYKEDTFFKSILEKPNEFWNFEIVEKLIYLKEEVFTLPHLF